MAEAVINDIFNHSSSTDDGAVRLLEERSIKNLNELKLWCHQLQNFYLRNYMHLLMNNYR